MTNKKTDIEHSIKVLTRQITLFKKVLNKSSVSDKIYNRMLVERAVYIDKLKAKKNSNFMKDICKKLGLLKQPQKTLICDYFCS